LVRGFLVVFQPWLASSAQEWLEGLNLRPAVDGFIEKARQTVADQKDDWGRHEPKPGTFATDDPPIHFHSVRDIGQPQSNRKAIG
jgi:hypothetical protein